MADSRKIVKVFLASPGDLSDERRAAKSVVDEYNALTADDFGYQVELVGWEDTVSVYGRPQATINRDLERCELFIGLMWKKWGTPPDVSGAYTSGFEEEFETSVQRRLIEGRPEISLLLKEIEPAFLGDPGEDLKKVLAFKAKLVAEKKIYFERFADIREFEKKVRRCIWNYVRQLRTQDINEASVKNQAPTTTGGEKKQAAETAISPRETPLSIEGAKFLREFISKTERSSKEEPIAAVEIARFRLLANLVEIQGNDDRALGVHDANLIFSEGGDFTFGHRELTGLMVSGLRHYSAENAPLWRWFAAVDGFEGELLSLYSIMGFETKQRTGSLEAMRLVAEPLPSDDDRNIYFDAWFAEDSPSDLKVAALSYLGDCGIAADIATIRKQIDSSDSRTASAAADAVIRINLRDSREKAIAALYELQPTSISRHVLDALFDNETALSTETLMDGVGHRNAEVRGVVVKLLRGRRALSTETAEQLINDSDATVRYEALMSLVEGGRIFSDAEAKRILVTEDRPASLGLRGAFGFGSPDPTSERCLAQYRGHRLRSLKDKELEEVAAEELIFDQAAQFALDERHLKLRGNELRQKVDDQYKATFSRAIDVMVERFGAGGSDTIEQTRSLENFTRKGLTRRGLDIICRQADPGDLGRVRSALKSGFVDYSAADVEYLRRFGKWEDIPLIIQALKRPEAGQYRSLLSSALDDSKYRAAARAIYALGQARLPEVLGISAPSQLMAHLIVEISAKTFRSLSDASITLLLRSEAEQVRKVTALMCVHALSKKRIAKLLASYVSGGQFRYYNVVHWLDFGVSIPRERALLAAERVLNREWRS